MPLDDTQAPPLPTRAYDTRSGASWSRTWRLFAAGLIIGVATLKASELLLHRERKPD